MGKAGGMMEVFDGGSKIFSTNSKHVWESASMDILFSRVIDWVGVRLEIFGVDNFYALLA